MLKKKFVRLEPVESMCLDEVDRHYTGIRFHFAATEFRTIPAVRACHSNRAIGQFDLTGAFDERPDAWRYVITQWDPSHDQGHAVAWLAPRLRELFFVDRVNGIAAVSSYEVEEEVVVDRRNGPTRCGGAPVRGVLVRRHHRR